MNTHNPSHLNNIEVWKKYRHLGDTDARKHLIEHYYPLVEIVVHRMAVQLPKNSLREDLASFGIVGLIDAIEKFDIDRGLQFETYATWRIRGAIIDGLRQEDWVPRSVRERTKRIDEAYQKLEQQYMRSVTDQEISEYLQVSEAEFQQMLYEASAATIFSLEDPIKEDEAETRLSLLVDEKAKNPENKVDELYLREMLSQAIDRLTPKERTVVSLFYFEDLSLSEIAQVMSLTPSRISQLHSKAILRLKTHLLKDKEQLI